MRNSEFLNFGFWNLILDFLFRNPCLPAGRGNPKEKRRHSFHLHREKDLLWNRSGADLSNPFPQDRPDRYPQPGEGEKGQTLLSEGSEGEGGPYSRRKETRSLKLRHCTMPN